MSNDGNGAGRGDHVSLERVRALAQALERGEQASANAILDEITLLRETDLFREMGSMTRQLHEALTSLQLDVSISETAAQAFPDAKERLDYVVAKTEEAAHRTLGAVEASMPVAEQIKARSAELRGTWERFHRKELSADEFRTLARETSEFFDGLETDAGTLNEKLNEVLMAQDFQDITGQVIRRVIELVQEVEGQLVQFIRVRGGAPAAPAPADPSRGFGPAVGAVAAAECVNGQDEVDDLLSSLGF